ncbi:MAG: SulP family inorganic anion transporter [Myxococcales bacterium]|nr:SulP family inorganic anion transporter [Myxococcales bacterium]
MAATSPFMTGFYRRVPAFDALRTYSFADARGDLLGGLSVAAVAVPQAMAYAMIAGLPAEYGLYTAIVMTAVGAIFDSSRQLINGPTNAISIALLSAIGGFETVDEKVQAAALLGALIGAIQLTISFARLGDLTRFISHSVIVGFTAGASLLLVLDQLKNLLGQKAVGDVHQHFLVRVWRSLREGGDVHLPTLLTGLSAIALVLLFRWAKSKLRVPLFPEFLVVVVIMAAATQQLGLAELGVKVVGKIPVALPSARTFSLDAALIRDLAPSALAVGLLGLLEAVAMSKALAAVNRQKLDANQQCFSEGMANLVGSCFGCMPGSGSLTRSAINQQAGARTQWAGVISAAAVATIVVLFGGYAQFIPRSALAGLLMLTAARMVNLRELRYHVRASSFDAWIVGTTAVAAFAISIEFCVLIGVVMSFMLAVPRTGNMLLTEFVVAADGGVHERVAEDHVCGRILIFGLEGEMFFGSALSLDEHFDGMEARILPETKVMVLRLKRARNPDAVGMALLEGVIDRLTARGVRVITCGVRSEMYESFERCGIARKLAPEQIFRESAVRQTSTLLAIRHAYELVTEPCPACPRRVLGRESAMYFVI